MSGMSVGNSGSLGSQPRSSSTKQDGRADAPRMTPYGWSRDTERTSGPRVPDPGGAPGPYDPGQGGRASQTGQPQPGQTEQPGSGQTGGTPQLPPTPLSIVDIAKAVAALNADPRGAQLIDQLIASAVAEVLAGVAGLGSASGSPTGSQPNNDPLGSQPTNSTEAYGGGAVSAPPASYTPQGTPTTPSPQRTSTEPQSSAPETNVESTDPTIAAADPQYDSYGVSAPSS